MSLIYNSRDSQKRTTAVFAVLYPGVESYIDDFINSLRIQTYRDFDLLIINDGYSTTPIHVLYPDLNVLELDYCSTPAKNREFAINYVIERRYEYLILCDADDYFDPLRIELTLNALQVADIAVNDLCIVSEKKEILQSKYYSCSISESTVIDSNFILEKNIFGFSNTGIRVDRLNRLSIPTELKIVDWYLFSILLNSGLSVKYIPKSLTFYRQHNTNCIGIGNYNVESFRRLLALKLAHYHYLSKINKSFLLLEEKYLKLSSVSDKKIESIINDKLANYKCPLWWEIINF